MGFFSNLRDKFSEIANIGGKKSNKSSVELQYDKAMSLMENANGLDAVEILEGIADIGFNDSTYKNFGLDALTVLSEFFELGHYSNAKTEKDLDKAASYLEKFSNLSNDPESIYRTAKMYLEAQNFTKAISLFEKSTQLGVKSAYMNLGSIYENGLCRVDEYGNKSDFIGRLLSIVRL